jgi:lysophospholipase L1-like esterase
LTSTPAPRSSSSALAVGSTLPPSPEPPHAPPATKPISIGKGTRVLVIGDSMASTLAIGMKEHVQKAGGSFAKDIWAGSTTRQWANSGRLETALAQHKPDVVFVVLGSNEVLVQYPEVLIPWIKRLVGTIAPRPCAWIGAPVWKAIGKRALVTVAVEKENAAPCAFFDSTKVEISRWPDGIHPNIPGGRKWFNTLWEELVEIKAE